MSAVAYLQCGFVRHELLVDLVGSLQEAVDAGDGLLAVLLALDGVDGAAGPGRQRVLELGVLAEAAGVTQERVLLVVVDGSEAGNGRASAGGGKYTMRAVQWQVQAQTGQHAFVEFQAWLTDLHLWHWKTFSPQLPQTPGWAGTEALHRGHCSVSEDAWNMAQYGSDGGQTRRYTGDTAAFLRTPGTRHSMAQTVDRRGATPGTLQRF